jgi:hypothetical protein
MAGFPARIGLPAQNGKDKTTRAEQKGEDWHVRLPEQDSQNEAGRTRMPGKNY